MASTPAMAAALAPPAVWVMCGGCWGQRVIHTTTGIHGVLEPGLCPWCLGIGEVVK